MREEGLVMLCLLESVHQLSPLLRFGDFLLPRGFLAELPNTDTVREQRMKSSASGKLQRSHKSEVTMCIHRESLQKSPKRSSQES